MIGSDPTQEGGPWHRPHRWQPDNSCSLCAMRRSWVGARYSCTGVDIQGNKKKAKARGKDYTSAERNLRRRDRLGNEAMRAEWREAQRRSRSKRAAASAEPEARR